MMMIQATKTTTVTKTELGTLLLACTKLIGMMDNPSSRIDFSKDSTLSRNKSNAPIVTTPSVDLQPIQEEVIPGVLKAPSAKEAGE